MSAESPKHTPPPSTTLELVDDIENGATHAGDLEAIFASNLRRVEAKSVQELQLELEAVRLRLVRRSQIMDVLRKAYVRDVVTIKNELTRKAAMTEEEYYAKGGPGTEIADAVPSLDMRPALSLFSPEDSFLRVETCSSCGGHLEIVTRETKRVAKLSKKISGLIEQAEEGGKEIANLKAGLSLTRRRISELEERNVMNRDTLVSKLEKTQRACEVSIVAVREQSYRAERAWEAKIAQKNKELEAVAVLRAEGKALRAALEEQASEREDDIYVRDGKIARLTSEVERLEEAVDLTSKLLLAERNKTEDFQHRLKAEKTGHETTTRLFKEEHARYERCRESLEKAKEDLADLDQRFNELRTELEMNNENAEDEAGEQQEALAATRAENRRLRAMLSSASSGETSSGISTSEVSALVEELDTARLDARKASRELKALEAKNARLTAEAEELKVKVLAISSSSAVSVKAPESDVRDAEESDSIRRSSDGGGDDTGDQNKLRTHSTRGEAIAETFVSHRPVVSKQEGGEASRSSCADAATMTTEERAPSTQDLDAMKATLEDSFQARLSEAHADHEAALEAVHSELEVCKQELSTLGDEAEELRQKLKHFDKMEMTKKDHSVVTEELRRMEAETGFSVGLSSSEGSPPSNGYLNREEEQSLLDERDKVQAEMKSLKARHALVTHELLGNIKGANAEVEILRAELAKVTAERDKRVDPAELEAKGLLLPGAGENQLTSLKAENQRQRFSIAALKEQVKEGSETLKALLKLLSESCKDARRAKMKVWNAREIERARSIPAASSGETPVAKHSSAAHVVRRGSLSSLRGRARKVSGGGSFAGSGDAPVAESEREGDKAATKEAELERRRRERAEQAKKRELQEAADAKEQEELKGACASPVLEGIAFATKRLEATRTDLKQQFKEVFQELKEALEMHKKFVLRSRIESREEAACIASLEAELERVATLSRETEQELEENSAALRKTESSLQEANDSAAKTSRALEVAESEAMENLYFKDKNASLQKQLDHEQVVTKKAHEQYSKATEDLEAQNATVVELRELLRTSEASVATLRGSERELKEKMGHLQVRLQEVEDITTGMKRTGNSGPENTMSQASQAWGYSDPDLGFGRSSATQTNFHCPTMTLRRQNSQRMFPARASSAGSGVMGLSASPWGLVEMGGEPGAGVVYPAVDGRPLAAEKNLHDTEFIDTPWLSHGAQSWGVTQVIDAVDHGRSCGFTQSPAQFTQGLSYSPRGAHSGTLPPEEGVLTVASAAGTHPGAICGSLTSDGQHGDIDSQPHLGRPRCRTAGQTQRIHNDCPRGTPSRSENDPWASPEGGQGQWSRRSPSSDGPPGSPRRRRMHSRFSMQGAVDQLTCPREPGREHGTQGTSGVSTFTSQAGLLTPGRVLSGASNMGPCSGSPIEDLRWRPVTSPCFVQVGQDVGTRPQTGAFGSACVRRNVLPPGTVERRENAAGSSQALESMVNPVIPSDVPCPRVWGDEQMMSAVAAATGKRRAGSTKRDGRVTSKGGVAIDMRMVKTRELIRADVLDAAERAGLPLLQ